MSVLLITAQEKAAIKDALERARTRAMPLRSPEQVLIPVGYRATVTFERQLAGMFMHLTISIDRTKCSETAPSPQAIRAIAAEFGLVFPISAKVWAHDDGATIHIMVMVQPSYGTLRSNKQVKSMPQATPALRALMENWFGDPIDDRGPTDFLLSHGFTERDGLWAPPVQYHNLSREEFACLRFLVDEWDHGYEVATYYLEDARANGDPADR